MKHKVWTKLLQTPCAPRADCRTSSECTEFCFCVCVGHEQLGDNKRSTNNAQRSRTTVPLTEFVCGVGETGNKIMLRALAVCTEGLSKSNARPGEEYQSRISQSGLWK